jgi:hypothetical protein
LEETAPAWSAGGIVTCNGVVTGFISAPYYPGSGAAPCVEPDLTNPKDLLGVKKVSLSKVPPVAVAQCAMALMDGAEKYGAYNWREKAVRASIYVDACERHLLAWFDGEERAQDSGVHHLAHAMACLAILLDAQATGNLVDDRPAGGAFARVMAELNSQLAKDI